MENTTLPKCSTTGERDPDTAPQQEQPHIAGVRNYLNKIKQNKMHAQKINNYQEIIRILQSSSCPQKLANDHSNNSISNSIQIKKSRNGGQSKEGRLDDSSNQTYDQAIRQKASQGQDSPGQTTSNGVQIDTCQGRKLSLKYQNSNPVEGMIQGYESSKDKTSGSFKTAPSALIKDNQNHQTVPIELKPHFKGLRKGGITNILMTNSEGFWRQNMRRDQEFGDFNDSVYVSYDLYLDGFRVRDQFLWPKANREVYDMKLFALTYLSDITRQKFREFDEQSLEGFASHVTYIIQRELDLADLDGEDFLSLTKDGLFGPGAGIAADKEHLVKINLNLEFKGQSLVDEFYWDITDPDNCPEEFAAQSVDDLRLPRVFQTAIALNIRRQISNYVLTCAQAFKENLGAHIWTDFPTTGVAMQGSMTKEELIYSLPSYCDEVGRAPRVNTSPLTSSTMPAFLANKRKSKELEDVSFITGLALKNAGFQPKGNSELQLDATDPKSQRNKTVSSKKATPQKITSQKSTPKSSSLQPQVPLNINQGNSGTLVDQIKTYQPSEEPEPSETINGCNSMRKRAQKEQSKGLPHPDFSLVLQKQPQGLYEIFPGDSKRQKVREDETALAPPKNQSPLTIQISKSQVASDAHKKSDKSPAQLKLNFPQSQKRQSNSSSTEDINQQKNLMNNHLIKLDLKTIFKDEQKQLPQAPGRQTGQMVSNDLEDEAETNGAGSISGNKKGRQPSSEEDNGEDEEQRGRRGDLIFQDFE